VETRDIRDIKIYGANIQFGYSLKEIADHLRIHHTTVSKAIKKVDDKTLYFKT